ncbi:hypothetical protein [Poriferisphaera sp. WC338]|uniref:hypothetical protein n=1 Tax=Poriferisphaera sp. WC338 TaxID=3425129 RepID=UPI003D819E5B
MTNVANRYWSILMLLAMALILGGCSTYQVQAMPQISPKAAPASTSAYEVDFGAKPYVTETEAKAVFNYDMMSKGVMPVFVAVENHADQDIEILRARFELQTGSGVKLLPVLPVVASTMHGRNAMAEAFWYFGIFSYDNANKYNEALKRDWAEKAWPEVSIIRSGHTKSGFLYFKVGENYKHSKSILSVPFEIDGFADRKEVKLFMQ